MRGDKYVGKGEQTRQFVVLQDLTGKIFKENTFLFLVDIQRNAADMSAFQSLDEGLGMNKAPSADVDEHDSGFHQGQGFRIKDPDGRFPDFRSSRLSEASACRQVHAGASASNECDFVVKRQVHNSSLDLVVSCARWSDIGDNSCGIDAAPRPSWSRRAIFPT